MITTREAYMRASSFLGERGVSEPAASAEMLLQHALGVTRTRLLALWSDPVEHAAFETLWTLLQRRAAGEPVQYITGEAFFYGRRFAVGRGVLIPRPETELLVERALTYGDALWGKAGTPRVVDAGTGSGAISVTLAAERPSWRVAASDVSAEALLRARENAFFHGVAERMDFLEGDWLKPALAAYGAGGIDAVISNPPYIRTPDMAGLQVEVRDFEPQLALDGGDDGLDPYRDILGQLAAAGARPRLIGLECGLGQARELSGLLRSAGQWDEFTIVEDYAGIERHVFGVRTEP